MACRGFDLNIQSSACKAIAFTDCAILVFLPGQDQNMSLKHLVFRKWRLKVTLFWWDCGKRLNDMTKITSSLNGVSIEHMKWKVNMKKD